MHWSLTVALSLELDDESGRIRRIGDPLMQADSPKVGWPWTSLRGEPSPRPLLLAADRAAEFLPIRIARHARTITQETVVSAQVSRRVGRPAPAGHVDRAIRRC